MNFVVARAELLEKNREAVIDYDEDCLRGLDWLLASANREEAIAIIARPADLAKYLDESFVVEACKILTARGVSEMRQKRTCASEPLR